MRKVPEDNDLFFINTAKVQSCLDATGKNKEQVLCDLGWGNAALASYMCYQNKITRKKLYELADYFNQSKKQIFISYHPSQKIIAIYKRNKKRRHDAWTNNDSDQIKDSEVNNLASLVQKLLNQQIILTTAVNNLDQRIKNNSNSEDTDLRDFIDDQLIDSTKKVNEVIGKQQSYIVSQLKDIQKQLTQDRLNRHFRG